MKFNTNKHLSGWKNYFFHTSLKNLGSLSRKTSDLAELITSLHLKVLSNYHSTAGTQNHFFIKNIIIIIVTIFSMTERKKLHSFILLIIRDQTEENYIR